MAVTEALANVTNIQGIFQALTTVYTTAYLFSPDVQLNDGDTFDYIVVGAGSAGCVIASRLSEMKATVLLVEAGDDPPLDSLLPYYMAYLKESKWDWNYTSIPEWTQKCHKGKVAEMTRGKMLGGCSSNNYMAYVRGNPHDYDTWADVVKDESWNYDNVLRLFKKSENLQDDLVLSSPTGVFHGTEGYLKVTRQSESAPLKYLEAYKEIGRKVVLDTNARDTLGFSQPMSTIADGVRQSTAYSFLRPARDRPNLFIAKNTLCTKINFDKNNNAIGIETVNGDKDKKIFKASKEVIISAGTINSAQLLMLSGIGPKKHLEEVGIPVLADLPVGENLQDHPGMLLVYPTEKSSGPEKPVNPHKLPSPQILGYVAINQSQTYPDYQAANLIVTPDGLLQLCAFSFSYNNDICEKFYEESVGKEVLFVLVVPLHAKSRGRILLRSRDPEDYPIMNLNTYAITQDLEDAVTFLKDFNKITKSKYFQSVNAKVLTPLGCEGLDLDSKEYWLCQAQCMVTSFYHYVGTCAMGSVVDSRLRVFGVQKLRIADGSVIPNITSGNTNVPIIMVGEKAAEMVIEDNLCG